MQIASPQSREISLECQKLKKEKENKSKIITLYEKSEASRKENPGEIVRSAD